MGSDISSISPAPCNLQNAGFSNSVETDPGSIASNTGVGSIVSDTGAGSISETGTIVPTYPVPVQLAVASANQVLGNTHTFVFQNNSSQEVLVVAEEDSAGQSDMSDGSGSTRPTEFPMPPGDVKDIQMKSKIIYVSFGFQAIGAEDFYICQRNRQVDAAKGSTVSIQERHIADAQAAHGIRQSTFSQACRRQSAGAAKKVDQPVNVRDEDWYSHYRHTVFAMIGSAHNSGCRQFKLVQVKPPPRATRTNEEFPALQQDLNDAYSAKKSPFYDREREKIQFQSIKFTQEDIDALPTFFNIHSRNSSCVIVVSCERQHFDKAAEMIQQHNSTAQRCGLNQVITGWATGGDMYTNGKRS
jgi:hypothetical protein